MKRLLLAGLLTAVFAAPSLAGDIAIDDAYARSSNPKSGAAFMTIRNAGAADRLIEARTDIARNVELHTHIEEDGVMKMREVEGGIELPAQSLVELKRGGLHVMFMGLKAPMEHGDSFPLTLVFESGMEMTIDVPVDLERRPSTDRSGHNHSHSHEHNHSHEHGHDHDHSHSHEATTN
ncbi:MAG: copper chaperone PCu(A)C [Pseudomonadota bacterium]